MASDMLSRLNGIFFIHSCPRQIPTESLLCASPGRGMSAVEKKGTQIRKRGFPAVKKSGHFPGGEGMRVEVWGWGGQGHGLRGLALSSRCRAVRPGAAVDTECEGGLAWASLTHLPLPLLTFHPGRGRGRAGQGAPGHPAPETQ